LINIPTFVGNVCTDCALAKARQCTVPKETTSVTTKAGERLYIDISSTKASSFGGAKFWLLIVDQHTDFCWSAFLLQKSTLADRVQGFLRSLNANADIGVGTIHIHLDNAGENVQLKNLLEASKIRCKFGFFHLDHLNLMELSNESSRHCTTVFGHY
jgi:hypothetical protein